MAYSIVASAQERIVYRSTRAEGHSRMDERKLPQRGVRGSHWGWEVRTPHFVVFSTESPEQASWAAGQFETAWSDTGRLADQWTAAHRQPDFGIGAVSVLIANQVIHPRAAPAPGPRPLNDDAVIFVDLTKGPRDLAKRLPDLRREAFLAFLRVAQQDRVIPDWVQSGLADYVGAGHAPPQEAQPRTSTATSPSATSSSAAAKARIGMPAQDRTSAALWVRYLLEGDDARHAPSFFAALASVTGTTRGVDSFDALIAKASATDRPDKWLADPDVGQPLVRTLPENMPLAQTHREMVFLLKLARRFPAAASHAIAPRVIEGGMDRTKERTAPAPGPQPLDLAALYRRLTDPRQPRWATLDARGDILFSDDQGRLEQVLGDAWRTYRVTLRDGRNVLETRLPGGEVVEAWLEENLENPDRPLVYVKHQSYVPPKPKAVSPSAAPAASQGGSKTDAPEGT